MDILQHQGTGIALILLDIVMPEMDGFEVLSQMEPKPSYRRCSGNYDFQ